MPHRRERKGRETGSWAKEPPGGAAGEGTGHAVGFVSFWRNRVSSVEDVRAAGPPALELRTCHLNLAVLKEQVRGPRWSHMQITGGSRIISGNSEI